MTRFKPPAPSLWERAVGRIAPDYARNLYRTRAGFTALAGGYVGARRDRKATKEWSPSGGSSDTDLLPDLPTLRERSRDLVRNMPLARGAINTNVTSVVGPGLRLKPQIDRAFLGLSDEAADAWEDQAERLWCRWTEPEECDLTSAQSFEEMQALVLRSTLESGDCFAVLRMRPRAGALFETRFELLEADMVSNPNRQQDKAALAGGVEIDADGRPLAYHVSSQHPGALTLGAVKMDWRRFAARADDGTPLVLHVYDKVRIGQRRGEPYFAPVIEALKQLKTYGEAELDAAVLASFFTVFVKAKGREGFAANTAAVAETDSATGRPEYKLGKGAIVNLDTDEDVSTASPGRPNDAFEPFFLAVCRQIGVALDIPYEVLIKHFTASYSAARAALLEAWRAFRMRRAWLARRFCQPAWQIVLAEAVSRNLIAAPGFFADPLVRMAWCGAQWIGPAAGQIDPVKETDAAVTRMGQGLSTLAEETAALSGGDWESNLRQRKRELALAKEAGLAAGAPAPAAAPEQAPTKDEEEQNPDKPEGEDES